MILKMQIWNMVQPFSNSPHKELSTKLALEETPVLRQQKRAQIYYISTTVIAYKI